MEGIKINIQTYCIDGHQDIDTPFTIKEPLPESARVILNLVVNHNNEIGKNRCFKFKWR